jgi:diguanylate cyclase (GGDEF)-like protein
MGLVKIAMPMLHPVMRWLENLRSGALIIIGIFLTLLIGVLDRVTGYELSFSLFYLVPIALVSRYGGKGPGFFMSGLAAGIWLWADLADGHVYSHPLIPYWNATGRLGFFLIVAYAIVTIRFSLQSLKETTRTDFLTGAANVRGFQERAEIEIERARRNGKSFTVAYIDLDNFKIINDKGGHSVGDDLLACVAESLKQNIRKTDVLGRLGGDEFAILFPETGQKLAYRLTNRLREEVLEKMRTRDWPVTLSIGVVTFLSPPASLDEMVRTADQTMYLAKEHGKNRLIATTYG